MSLEDSARPGFRPWQALPDPRAPPPPHTPLTGGWKVRSCKCEWTRNMWGAGVWGSVCPKGMESTKTSAVRAKSEVESGFLPSISWTTLDKLILPAPLLLGLTPTKHWGHFLPTQKGRGNPHCKGSVLCMWDIHSQLSADTYVLECGSD